MRAVNLLPADAYERKRWWSGDALSASPKRILAGGGIAAAVLALSLVGAYVLQSSIVNDRREKLAGLEQEVGVVEAKAAEIRAQQDSATALQAAFTAVTTRRITWEKILVDLSRVLPPNAFLQTLTATSPTSATADSTAATGVTPAAFSVTGFTSSQPAVALVLDRLELLPWLSDVTLQSSAQLGAETAGVTFTINANLISTGRTG